MEYYLSATIESVLAQDYPRIEYLVMDGGSTDSTAELLRRYEGRLRWVIQPDRGAADAINAGFAQTRGTILSWISADDLYLPGAIGRVMAAFEGDQELDVVYGDGLWIDSAGQTIGTYPTRDFDPALFGRECYLCQPAVFFRRRALERAGPLNTDLQTAYDYDLWIRLARCCRFRRIPGVLACSRMHRSNKTMSQRRTVFLESMQLQRSWYGYVPMSSVLSYAAYITDGRDQFWEPLAPDLRAYARSLPAGLSWNRRKPLRFLLDWARAGPGILFRTGVRMWR